MDEKLPSHPDVERGREAVERAQKKAAYAKRWAEISDKISREGREMTQKEKEELSNLKAEFDPEEPTV